MGSLWDKHNVFTENFTLDYIFTKNDTDLLQNLASSTSQFKVLYTWSSKMGYSILIFARDMYILCLVLWPTFFAPENPI